MKNNSNLIKYLYLFLISSIINISSEKYYEFDMISNKTNLVLLSIISKDNNCQTYIPSLFNPIPLIKRGDYRDIVPQFYQISISNPIMYSDIYFIFLGNIIDSNLMTILGIRNDFTVCYFGLSSGLPLSIELKEKNNTLDYLKITNQMEKKYFLWIDGI